MSWLLKECVLTVSHSEMIESPDENIASDRITIVRTLKCSWDNRYQLAQELMGYIQFAGVTTIIHLPHRYIPTGGYVGELRVSEILGIKGFGALVENPVSTEYAEYHEALITVKYTTPDYIPTTGDPAVPLISESIEPTTEFFTYNHKNFYWDSAGEKPMEAFEAPGGIVSMFDWVYTIHRALTIPQPLLDAVGYTNSKELTSRSLGRTFEKESLVLRNPSTQREHTSMGITMWQITVRLTYRSKEWNKFPDTSDLDAEGNIRWKPIYNSSGRVAKPVPLKDLTGIII
jgi:hypothetical protein